MIVLTFDFEWPVLLMTPWKISGNPTGQSKPSGMPNEKKLNITSDKTPTLHKAPEWEKIECHYARVGILTISGFFSL